MLRTYSINLAYPTFAGRLFANAVCVHTCVCAHTCACACVYVYGCVHVCACVWVGVHVCWCVHEHACVHVYGCARVCTCVCVHCVGVCACVYVYGVVHVCVGVCGCVHKHACMCMGVHTFVITSFSQLNSGFISNCYERHLMNFRPLAFGVWGVPPTSAPARFSHSEIPAFLPTGRNQGSLVQHIFTLKVY